MKRSGDVWLAIGSTPALEAVLMGIPHELGEAPSRALAIRRAALTQVNISTSLIGHFVRGASAVQSFAALSLLR